MYSTECKSLPEILLDSSAKNFSLCFLEVPSPEILIYLNQISQLVFLKIDCISHKNRWNLSNINFLKWFHHLFHIMVAQRFYSRLQCVLCPRPDAKVWLFFHVSHNLSTSTCLPCYHLLPVPSPQESWGRPAWKPSPNRKTDPDRINNGEKELTVFWKR